MSATKKPTKKTAKPASKQSGKKTEKKMSALDAAAQVLKRKGESMQCKALIDVMTSSGLWTSPGGKTPHATLYSAILREINTKGKESRFKKIERGQFAFAGKGA